MDNLPDNVTREGGDEVLKPTFNPIPQHIEVTLPAQCTWTNEASSLGLATYFDPAKPNLAAEYGLNGLQPVIRDSGSDRFLLKDDTGNFYQWDSRDGTMWHLVGLSDVKQAVASIMRDSGILQKAQVWNLFRA